MPRNYDFVAPFYPMLERAAFGAGLTEARHASLNPVLSARSALLIGEGNGRFLASCVETKLGGSITVVDSSEKMLSLASARLRGFAHKTNVELVHADFCDWSPPQPHFDVIVTHFFLDLFRPESQRRLIEKITSLSTTETIWMNVDYRPVIHSRLHRIVEWLQYRFDRLLSGIEADRHYDSAPIITEFGWTILKDQSFCRGTIYSHLLTAPLNSAVRIQSGSPAEAATQQFSPPRTSRPVAPHVRAKQIAPLAEPELRTTLDGLQEGTREDRQHSQRPSGKEEVADVPSTNTQ